VQAGASLGVVDRDQCRLLALRDALDQLLDVLVLTQEARMPSPSALPTALLDEKPGLARASQSGEKANTQTRVSPLKRPLHLGHARHFLNVRAVDVSC
jgi:hypothetical protein